MHRTLQHLILACQLLTAGHALAQAPAEPAPTPAPPAPEPAPAKATAPLRSIAVLVDVSGSVSAEYAVEARSIVSDIVSGRGFRAAGGWVSNYDVPEVVDPAGEDAWPDDEALKSVFKGYWTGGQGLNPLTGSGKAFVLSSIGTIKTTVAPPTIRYINGVPEFEQLLLQEYPSRKDQFRDGHTCYYIGVARTADVLLNKGGCYLFVVSDEWDDPDSRSKQTPEWMPYLREQGIYDVHYPLAMVSHFHELKNNNRFHLIARFHKGDRPGRTKGSRSYLRVSWYSIGEKPQAVEPVKPPVVKPGEPPPPPPVVPVPPVFERTLTLLGGLIAANDAGESVKPDAARIKVFDHPNPFITWQVDGVSSVDSQYEVVINRLNEGGSMESVHKLKAAQLAKTTEGRLRGLPTGIATPALANGIYRVTIEEKPASGTAPGGGKTLGPLATWIEVKAPFNWVPWLLGVSVLGAAGVIGYSVWTLRR